MALIVEDGSIVPGAETYATAAELVTYAAKRNLTIPSTTAEQEVLLIKAMDYLEGFDYKGVRSYPRDQSQPWPRYGAYVNDYMIYSDEIPQNLKNAQMEAAIAAINIDLSTNEIYNNVQSEKLDVLEVSYFPGGKKSKLSLKRVANYLQPYLMDNLKLYQV